MAAKKQAAPAPKTKEPSIEFELDDEAHYRVTMLRRVELNRSVTLRKGSTPTLKGRVIKEVIDDVTDIQPIAS